jgi:hypothetical protein
MIYNYNEFLNEGFLDNLNPIKNIWNSLVNKVKSITNKIKSSIDLNYDFSFNGFTKFVQDYNSGKINIDEFISDNKSIIDNLNTELNEGIIKNMLMLAIVFCLVQSCKKDDVIIPNNTNITSYIDEFNSNYNMLHNLCEWNIELKIELIYNDTINNSIKTSGQATYLGKIMFYENSYKLNITTRNTPSSSTNLIDIDKFIKSDGWWHYSQKNNQLTLSSPLNDIIYNITDYNNISNQSIWESKNNLFSNSQGMRISSNHILKLSKDTTNTIKTDIINKKINIINNSYIQNYSFLTDNHVKTLFGGVNPSTPNTGVLKIYDSYFDQYKLIHNAPYKLISNTINNNAINNINDIDNNMQYIIEKAIYDSTSYVEYNIRICEHIAIKKNSKIKIYLKDNVIGEFIYNEDLISDSQIWVNTYDNFHYGSRYVKIKLPLDKNISFESYYKDLNFKIEELGINNLNMYYKYLGDGKYSTHGKPITHINLINFITEINFNINYKSYNIN